MASAATRQADSTQSAQLFDAQMRRLFGNWSAVTADAGICSAKKEEFRPIFERVGIVRFQAGVTKCIRDSRSSFFPTVGEFSEYIPEASDRRPVNSSCSFCSDGWVEVKSIEDGKVVKRLRRCQCHPAYRGGAQ